jgi:thymidylate kinase
MNSSPSQEIYIEGPDGSGKDTVADMLVLKLSHYTKVKRNRLGKKTEALDWLSNTVFHKNRIFRYLTVVYCICIWFVDRLLPHNKPKIVVSLNYVRYLAYLKALSNHNHSIRFLEWLLSLSKPFKQSFMLKTAPHILQERIKKRGHVMRHTDDMILESLEKTTVFTDALEYLTTKYFKATVIDNSNQTVEETVSQIMAKILSE